MPVKLNDLPGNDWRRTTPLGLLKAYYRNREGGGKKHVAPEFGQPFNIAHSSFNALGPCWTDNNDFFIDP